MNPGCVVTALGLGWAVSATCCVAAACRVNSAGLSTHAKLTLLLLNERKRPGTCSKTSMQQARRSPSLAGLGEYAPSPFASACVNDPKAHACSRRVMRRCSAQASMCCRSSGSSVAAGVELRGARVREGGGVGQDGSAELPEATSLLLTAWLSCFVGASWAGRGRGAGKAGAGRGWSLVGLGSCRFMACP